MNDYSQVSPDKFAHFLHVKFELSGNQMLNPFNPARDSSRWVIVAVVTFYQYAPFDRPSRKALSCHVGKLGFIPPVATVIPEERGHVGAQQVVHPSRVRWYLWITARALGIDVYDLHRRDGRMPGVCREVPAAGTSPLFGYLCAGTCAH